MVKTKWETNPTTPQAIVVSNPPDEEEEVDEEIEIFNHVLKNVLNKDSTSPLYLALVEAEYQNIWDLVTLNSDEIDNFPSAQNTTLRLGEKNLLNWFIRFYDCHKDALHLPDEWYQITRKEFNQFRIQKASDFRSNFMNQVTPSQTILANRIEDDSTSDSKFQTSRKKFICSAKVTDKDWKGSTRGFLLHWEKQVRLY